MYAIRSYYESGCVLRIPIVQGEFEAAHLCRLVGALELRGDQLSATVPRGSTVELTIEIVEVKSGRYLFRKGERDNQTRNNFV